MTKWDHWKNLTKDKKEWDESDTELVSSYSNFQMTKLLSQIKLCVEHAQELNCVDVPKETHYRYLFNLLPKSYLAITETKAKKHSDDDEKLVAKYFEFGSKDLKMAMEMLSEKDIRNIKRKFGMLK